MDGRSASEKEGRFCKIKKVVSFSSDGLKRHKVLVVLDQVRREGEDETDYSLSVCLWLLLLNFLPASLLSLFQFSAFLFLLRRLSLRCIGCVHSISCPCFRCRHILFRQHGRRGDRQKLPSPIRAKAISSSFSLSLRCVCALSISLSPPSVFIPLFQFSVNLFQSPLPP